jgi:hypothetical protein
MRSDKTLENSMKIWLPLVLSSGLLAATPVQASYLNTAHFLERCSAMDSDSATFCVGYLEGVADELAVARALARNAQCIPPGVTVGQLKGVVLGYLRNHPAPPQEVAAEGVTKVIITTWHCR